MTHVEGRRLKIDWDVGIYKKETQVGGKQAPAQDDASSASITAAIAPAAENDSTAIDGGDCNNSSVSDDGNTGGASFCINTNGMDDIPVDGFTPSNSTSVDRSMDANGMVV